MELPLALMIIFINLIVFGFVGSMVKLGLDHRREQLRARRGEGSLGTSELKNLLRETVEEANGPLLDRIAELEARLDEVPRLLGQGEDEPAT